MSNTPHIVVVDDEQEIRLLLRDYLTRHGYAVSVAAGGTELRRVLAERPANLVVLDMMMPGENGIAIARELRAAGPIGVILLTAVADQVDRIAALEAGADDYVTKPFDPRELLARVRSVLRRATTTATAAGSLGREVRMGRCVLNLETARLYDLAGADVPLTAMEFDLLKAFAARPNRPMSRGQLLDAAHGRDMEPFERSVDLRILRLRRKLEADPEKPQALKTVRGIGYVFRPHGDPSEP